MERIATRQGYAVALKKLVSNKNIVVLDADLSKSTKTEEFAKLCPERFFNIGIAEQDLIGTAAGLALTGKIVLASSFAMFASGRAWEQIRNSVTIDALNVKIIATHGGISVGPDGASHQALEDVAIMRVLPNMKVIVPSCAVSAEKLILEAIQMPGPFYIRLGRSNVPVITKEEQILNIGKGNILKQGSDILIITCGILTSEAIEASKVLETKGYSVGIVDMHTIKPLDVELIKKISKDYKKIVTVEEHSIIGGLGSAVAEVLAEISNNYKPDFLRLGVNDTFGQSAEMDILLEKYGLDAKGITNSIINWKRHTIEK